MTRPCLPHDVLLLCARWSDPEHFPDDLAMSAWDWRNHYERRLEGTIAQWLARAMLAWHCDTRQGAAFAPVAHLVGTFPGDPDYIESIVRLCHELATVSDGNYRPIPHAGAPDTGQVCLGPCLENAIAPAVRLVAQRAANHAHATGVHLAALHDLLSLAQAVCPFNAAEPLCDAWDLLCRDGHAPFADDESRDLRHRFVLALAPLAHAGQRHGRLAQLVDGLARDAATMDPAMAADVRDAHAMLFGTGGTIDPDGAFPAPTAPPLPAGFPEGWTSAFAPGARQ